MTIRYLHSMMRVSNLDDTLAFFCDGLGFKEVFREVNEGGRFTNVFLATPADIAAAGGVPENPIHVGLPMLELTYNWDPEDYKSGRNFGHLAFEVEDIYAVCSKLQDMGVTIARPPRDGFMAFVRTPDAISLELLQKGGAKDPAEPWASMENTGSW